MEVDAEGIASGSTTYKYPGPRVWPADINELHRGKPAGHLDYASLSFTSRARG
jgi:hypothetical protein